MTGLAAFTFSLIVGQGRGGDVTHKRANAKHVTRVSQTPQQMKRPQFCLHLISNKLNILLIC